MARDRSAWAQWNWLKTRLAWDCVTRHVEKDTERGEDEERPKVRVVVFEMSRRLSRDKRRRSAADLSASRFDGERQKTAAPPARQPPFAFHRFLRLCIFSLPFRPRLFASLAAIDTRREHPTYTHWVSNSKSREKCQFCEEKKCEIVRNIQVRWSIVFFH